MGLLKNMLTFIFQNLNTISITSTCNVTMSRDSKCDVMFSARRAAARKMKQIQDGKNNDDDIDNDDDLLTDLNLGMHVQILYVERACRHYYLNL